jgi:hypothetical protein
MDKPNANDIINKSLVELHPFNPPREHPIFMDGIKTVAHGGAGGVPIPVPDIWRQKVSLNLKRLFQKTR